MKKLMSIVLILVLCLSLACPVLAAEDTFVPSIGVKDGPEVVPGTDEDGNPYVARVVDEEEQALDLVEEGCLVVTPVSQAETSEEIPEDSRDTLLDVYNQLVDGSMELPYDKFEEDLDPDKMVVRELVDASWLCEEHPELVSEVGVYVEIVFDLGVGEDTDVYVMAYVNGEWVPIVSAVNNGDGTVTCLFEEICPVAFSVYAGSSTGNTETGDTANLTLWIALLAISAVGLTAVLVLRRRVVR